MTRVVETSAVREALPSPDFAQVDRVREGLARGTLHPSIVPAHLERPPPDEVREIISVVCGELLENAVKYADWSAGRGVELHIDRERGPSGEELVVRVGNAVRPDDPALRELVTLVAWLAAQESALAAYQQRVLAIAAAAPPVTESRLGLLRIAYEAECALSVHVDAGWLVVEARLRLG